MISSENERVMMSECEEERKKTEKTEKKPEDKKTTNYGKEDKCSE